MSQWPQSWEPDIPISDPQAAYADTSTLLLAAAILAVLFIISQKEQVMKRFSSVAALWLIRAAVFVSLVSLPLYGYNDLDAFLYTATGGDPYLYTLTVYSVARFGVIHIPTLAFAACIALAFAMAPVLADWLIVAVTAIVERLQARAAWEQLETVEVYEVEEIGK